jgi:hypothetical protein
LKQFQPSIETEYILLNYFFIKFIYKKIELKYLKILVLYCYNK